MASIVKSNFSIYGVKYTDIKSRIEPRTNEIKIGVSGTAQMVRQWLKQKYPNIPSSDYTWVKSRKFANGNAIDIYLNLAPDEIYNDIRSELESNFEYGSYHYGTQQKTTKIASNTDSGIKIDYGTKYLSVENEAPSDVSAPIVNWYNLSQPSKKAPKSFTPKSSSGSSKTFDRGELISDCAGWEVNKKLYANGKILYSANKKPNTPKNKADWSVIKGEVLTETGFSYSKYGNFQKFGQIASESFVIAKLCEILGKYYINNAATQTNVPTNQYLQNAKLSEIADQLINTNNNLLAKLPTKDAFQDQLLYSLNWTNVLLDIPITEESNLLKGTEWKKSLREDIKNLTDNELISVGVIIKERNENLVNNVLGLCGIYGQKGIDLYKERYEKSPSVYLYPLWFETLLKNRTPQVTLPTTGLNESYKSIPPNPKLEFCAINRAEGSYPDDTFPIQFQSFTALTKFIADNIEEMPKKGEGYDKYFISYKWKFEDKEDGDRYDISEDGDNPYKYSNLWAFDALRSLCFYAWQTKGMSSRNYFKDDESYTDEIGKEGWELDSVQFMSLLSEIIQIFPVDKTKYDYNTKDERLDRFKEVYPKLFKLFSEQPAAITKESIQSIIKGYEIKAKRGDKSAEAIIKGYQIKLKRL